MELEMNAYKTLVLKSIRLVLNSLGDKESSTNHRNALVDHFTPVIGELCIDCQNRLESNPLRILDCKTYQDHPIVKNAPSILDYLNEYSQDYFTNVQTSLVAMIKS